MNLSGGTKSLKDSCAFSRATELAHTLDAGVERDCGNLAQQLISQVKLYTGLASQLRELCHHYFPPPQSCLRQGSDLPLGVRPWKTVRELGGVWEENRVELQLAGAFKRRTSVRRSCAHFLVEACKRYVSSPAEVKR